MVGWRQTWMASMVGERDTATGSMANGNRRMAVDRPSRMGP